MSACYTPQVHVQHNVFYLPLSAPKSVKQKFFEKMAIITKHYTITSINCSTDRVCCTYCVFWLQPFKAYWLRDAPTDLTINNCMLCRQCTSIYDFCIYLKTNSDLCHLHHKLIGFDVITSFLSGCIVGVGRVRTVTRAPLRVTSLVFDLSHTFPAL